MGRNTFNSIFYPIRWLIDSIATPICHIFKLSLEESLCLAWREAKVIPLPKSGKEAFTGSRRPINFLEKIVFDQIQCYFSVNKLTTDFQHAYREGYSTCTALTQMTDDWLEEIDNKKIAGAVLLDFSAAFDIIDHNLMLKKHALSLKNVGSLRNVLVFLSVHLPIFIFYFYWPV